MSPKAALGRAAYTRLSGACVAGSSPSLPLPEVGFFFFFHKASWYFPPLWTFQCTLNYFLYTFPSRIALLSSQENIFYAAVFLQHPTLWGMDRWEHLTSRCAVFLTGLLQDWEWVSWSLLNVLIRLACCFLHHVWVTLFSVCLSLTSEKAARWFQGSGGFWSGIHSQRPGVLAAGSPHWGGNW